MQKLKKNKKGFTLVELLVVIAIIGLLSTIAIVALNSARQKARDAKRVADIKQIQTALELYFNDQTDYPTEASGVTLGDSNNDTLSSGNGFAATASGTTYMGLVPADPQTSGTYTYTSADGSTYTITFTLEGQVGNFGSGTHTADPSGIQ